MTALDITYTRGLPGSGKTTWAREFLKNNPGYKRVNNDELRLLLDGEQFNPKNEGFVRIARKALIAVALGDRKNVLVDNCNLSPKAVAELENIAAAHGATTTVKDFTDVPFSECIRRDALRQCPVGRKVIKRMRDDFLRDQKVVYEHDNSLPKCILVDMDGTLAIHGTRGVYDFEHAGEDALNEAVAWQVALCHEAGMSVIIVTAREAKYREVTRDWLNKHEVPYNAIHMRGTFDDREDSIVKRELYENHIDGKYNVQAVFDDRNRVVNMWRDQLGLTVFQVAEGDF